MFFLERSENTTLTKAELKRLILSEVPRLIKRDPEIREFILRIASERFADKKKTEDRFDRLLEELKRDREENQRKWDENQRRLERLEREWNERRQENQKVINSMLEEIKLLHKRHDTGIGAIGARWGFRAESSFRGAIKGILEENSPLKVERYTTMDEEGIVFGRPDQIELDLIIKDGILIVAEIRSSISKGDVATFLRKIKVYETKEGRSVDKKLIISPRIDKGALEFARANGIRVYGYPEEVELSEFQE
ncbi:MAG: PD-(D/E)XK nuclease family protein [Desulfatiglandales bacterium]